MRKSTESQLAKQEYLLGKSKSDVCEALDDWRIQGNVRRLWDADASLWSGTDEDQSLGWLRTVDYQIKHFDDIYSIAEDVRSDRFKHVVVLGMGGSSLCPDVMRQTFGVIGGFPELLILDSTVPAQIKTLEATVDLAKTLFIVSSKSGRTTEPNALKEYFFDRVQQKVGDGLVGSHFVAITDPNTRLNKLAETDRFWHISHGMPNIGGRYSALSNFGMLPSALMGVDVRQFLKRAALMVKSCSSAVPPEINPGVALGLIMGTLAKQGRDKVTILTSPSIAALGMWLEQLLAESTGKEGTGLVPVSNENVGSPSVYGSDRLFVYVRLSHDVATQQDEAISALEKEGQPVVRITLRQKMDLGQEFFRWEIATAVAGSVLGVNAFDQPNVEASKMVTGKLIAAFEENGCLKPEIPILQDGNIELFADSTNAMAISQISPSKTLKDYLWAHLQRLHPSDYFSINAYVEMDDPNQDNLQAIRHVVRDRKRVATMLGFGPRFLHSTGQLHKGGPKNGVFLQITSEDAEDIPIPGRKYSFGVIKRLQAQGDFEVLTNAGFRVLRVHVGPDTRADLSKLRDVVCDVP